MGIGNDSHLLMNVTPLLSVTPLMSVTPHWMRGPCLLQLRV
jgi:hypothetical protein